MSMLTLTGVLVHIYTKPAKSNASYSSDEKDKLQVLADVPLENGQTRKELVTLTVPDSSKYAGQEGTELHLPVGVMAMAKNQLIFYVAKA
jgi:hypothetical protein